jgi:L-aspartate oxidase
LRRQEGRYWSVRAGSVVLATGGAGFRSELLGCRTNTGDGHLMAAEAGAEFSGMEFGCYYTIAADGSTMTRSMSYAFAQYFDAAGHRIHVPPGSENSRELAKALLDGPVFCSLDQIPEEIRGGLSRIQPNFNLPFQRLGIDPFRDRFQITLHGEGTIRGNGGVRVVEKNCAASIDNLFVAGDVASRELVAGASSGGGAINSAWAVSSGQWAGQGAAQRAKAMGRRAHEPVSATGAAGLRPRRGARDLPRREIVAAVQKRLLGYDVNIFRSGAKLEESVATLDRLWVDVRDHLGGVAPRDVADARETAALVATGRLLHQAALLRNESRGVHQRDDLPNQDAAFDAYLVTTGTDRIETRREPANHTPAISKGAAA